MGGRRKSEKLAAELADRPWLPLGERHESPHVVRRLCLLVDQRVTNGEDGLRIAQLAIRLAARLAGRHSYHVCGRPHEICKTPELAMGFARLAAALRREGRLTHADQALSIASETDLPDDLRSDLYRRRTILRLAQKRTEEALEDAKVALSLAPAGEDRARCLKTLGIACYLTDDYEGAISNLGTAVQTLDSSIEHSFIAAVVSYAGALAKGTDEQAREGLKLCEDGRRRLKPQHRLQRAKLWWVVGLLRRRLGAETRDTWHALDTARRSLVALKLAPEVAAITADMAAMVPDLPRLVTALCADAGLVVGSHNVLARPLHMLQMARRSNVVAAADVLRTAAATLASCPPGVN